MTDYGVVRVYSGVVRLQFDSGRNRLGPLCVGTDEQMESVCSVFVVNGWTLVASMKDTGICTDILSTRAFFLSCGLLIISISIIIIVVVVV